MIDIKQGLKNLAANRPDLKDWIDNLVKDSRLALPEDGTPKDDTVIVVAGPTHGGVVNAKQAPCSKCGLSVWIGPITQTMMNERPQGSKTVILCLDCAKEHSESDEPL